MRLVVGNEDELRIQFLNIGTDTCTVVECPGTSAPPMIVDCGSLGSTDNGLTENEAATYVQNVLSPTTVRPNVVISHADRGPLPIHRRAGDDADNIWQGTHSVQVVN